MNYQGESNLAVTEKSVWVFHKFDLGKGDETNQSLKNARARLKKNITVCTITEIDTLCQVILSQK